MFVNEVKDKTRLAQQIVAINVKHAFKTLGGLFFVSNQL